MNYYTAHELRTESGNVAEFKAEESLRRTASTPTGRYDIFLSHSSRDARIILGLYNLFSSQGMSVYVDWIDDPQLDRTQVSAGTADRLREVMKKSRSLVYATSRAASSSKWMPWELGYFDGLRASSRVAILPIEDEASKSFEGQEYIKLYKRIEKVRVGGTLKPYVIRTSRREGESLSSFVHGHERFNELVRG